MTDFDTALKDLVNAAVDRELAGHRVAPPFDRAALPTRPVPARRTTGWAAPVLAAAVVALLVVGSILVIGHDRTRRAGPVGTGTAPAPSVSRSIDPDQQEAARAYAEAVAGAREASEVAGVSVGPVSATDAVRYADSGSWTMPVAPPRPAAPGRSYPITVSYLAGPQTSGGAVGDGVSVISGELRDVASGSCPPPFLARPGHTYLISCQVTFRPDAVGSVVFTARDLTGTTGYAFSLITSAGSSTSPTDALARAAEASKVAGVSDRPASADELSQGTTVGPLEGAIVLPVPGKSYPMTLVYIPSSNEPAVAVLTIQFENVAAGHCPGPFRVRAGHAYQMRCQVTFRPDAAGEVYFTTTGPQGSSGSTGVGLSIR